MSELSRGARAGGGNEMKESQITPRVIKLSKEIAGHWRMEAYEGCWLFYVQNQQLTLAQISTQADVKELGFIPIPSISDCLEKLRELKWCIEISWIMEPRVRLDYVQPKEESKTIKTTGDTLHEALLSALLEVLRKEKK